MSDTRMTKEARPSHGTTRHDQLVSTVPADIFHGGRKGCLEQVRGSCVLAQQVASTPCADAMSPYHGQCPGDAVSVRATFPLEITEATSKSCRYAFETTVPSSTIGPTPRYSLQLRLLQAGIVEGMPREFATWRLSLRDSRISIVCTLLTLSCRCEW